MQQYPLRESHALVELDCPSIVLPHMKKTRFSAPSNSPHHLGHQNPGITAARVVRMSTNCTDFSKARNLEPLARHGHQRSITTNSEISSEFMRPDAEWPGGKR